MPTPLSPSIPKWDGQMKTLRNFLRIVEQLLRLAEISDDRQKLDWLISYVETDIADQWSSFPEFKTRPWNQFLDHLKIEYSELTSKEQGTMGQLRRLYREYSEISLLDEEQLMEFKWWFMYIAQKCLKPPTITRNQELIKLFVRSLDNSFQDALNARLSIQGTLKVDALGRSRMKDSYDLEHVIQKAVDLVSGKTIAWTLKHTPTIMSRNNKINPESRGQVSFSKEESVRKIEPNADVESLQQEINTLKTMYEIQEKTREKHEKSMQGALDSIRMLIQTQGQMQKEIGGLSNRYGSGPSQTGPPRPPRKCLYCFEPDYLFLFCLAKTEDKRKGLILVDKFTVRFANGKPIPTEHNMSIKDCVRKYLPSFIAVMMWGDPELETCSVWDQEPNTREIVISPQPIRQQVEVQSRSNG